MTEDPLIGYTLAGKYKILRFSGTEALGKVYSAQSRDGFVRVKILDPHVHDNPEWRTRFDREVQASKVMNHPNTQRMIDYGEHRVFHYLVLEYIQARTLSTEMAYLEVLPVERVCTIVVQVASALQAAHESDIIHRNLSPENILLLENTDGDYVKVRDFGMAFIETTAKDGVPDAVTQGDAVIGNALYISPEYVAEGDVDPRGDIYALGCIAYEMLVGEPPFSGATEGIVMSSHVERPVPRVDAVDPNVPTWLADLLERMMAKDPSDRPFNGIEVIQAIEEGLGYRVVLPELHPVELSATPAPIRHVPTTGRSRGRRSTARPLSRDAGLSDMEDMLPALVGVLGAVSLLLLATLLALVFVF